MTKNADVEWLRRELDPTVTPNGQWISLTHSRARRLLAHIDQLEAENARLIKVAENKIDINVRPTVHEIAAQIYSRMMRGMEFAPWAVRFAEFAYDAAEALIAEGRRRDGLQK